MKPWTCFRRGYFAWWLSFCFEQVAAGVTLDRWPVMWHRADSTVAGDVIGEITEWSSLFSFPQAFSTRAWTQDTAERYFLLFQWQQVNSEATKHFTITITSDQLQPVPCWPFYSPRKHCRPNSGYSTCRLKAKLLQIIWPQLHISYVWLSCEWLHKQHQIPGQHKQQLDRSQRLM